MAARMLEHLQQRRVRLHATQSTGAIGVEVRIRKLQ
jgi:hypothetical protein